MKGKTSKENMDLFYCYCIVMTESWKKGKKWKKWVFIWEALFDMKEKVQEILRPKKWI